MTRVTSIPPMGEDFEHSKPTIQALIEAINTGQRVRNLDILSSFVRVSDLVDLGILRLAANKKALIEFQPNFIIPTLQNSWVPHDALFYVPGFYKDALGRVHLRGLVDSGAAVPSVIFTLPAGYRPERRMVFSVASNAAFGTCYIHPNGDVYAQTGSSLWFSLDGISFAAVQ